MVIAFLVVPVLFVVVSSVSSSSTSSSVSVEFSSAKFILICITFAVTLFSAAFSSE
jgi:hypothetical protein